MSDCGTAFEGRCLSNPFVRGSKDDINLPECSCEEGCHAIVHFGSDSSHQVRNVARMFAKHGSDEICWDSEWRVPDGPLYFVCPGSALSLFGQPSGRGIVRQQLQEVSIPNHVRELCSGCFRGCSNLHRVI